MYGDFVEILLDKCLKKKVFRSRLGSHTGETFGV